MGGPRVAKPLRRMPLKYRLDEGIDVACTRRRGLTDFLCERFERLPPFLVPRTIDVRSHTRLKRIDHVRHRKAVDVCRSLPRNALRSPLFPNRLPEKDSRA